MRIRYTLRTVGLAVIALTFSACSIMDLVNQADPSSAVTNPTAIRTRSGALEAYRGVIVAMATAMGNGTKNSYLLLSGLFTDELRPINAEFDKDFPVGTLLEFDSRTVSSGNYDADAAFSALHRVRLQAQQARGLLTQYAPSEPRELHGHLYALEGFAELLLADLYCSGIPLSILDYDADYTLSKGLTTHEVYLHAIRMFDSAGKYSPDSTRFAQFAAIGRARAQLAIGDYTAAASSVTNVIDEFEYQLGLNLNAVPGSDVVLGDLEGGNGMPFVSGGDPRTQRSVLYDPSAPLRMASGVEARLIRAEAALHSGSSRWLDELNELRTSCKFNEPCPSPSPAGVGKVAGLALLEDPGIGLSVDAAMIVRLNLLFEERAYWLLLTGHRQGDLRRLVRNYGRAIPQVYPSGGWGAKKNVPYGPKASVMLPKKESDYNPLSKGCLNDDV